MRSATRLMMFLPAMLALGACAGSIQITTPAVGCSSLIPQAWTEPVLSAAFPADAASVRDWQVFGVEQTGQLRLANGRTSDVVAIVTACEARDAAAVRTIERPWWRWVWSG